MKEAVRVALVHATFDLAEGAENLTLNMYRALRELGHEVDLYAAHVDEIGQTLVVF